MPSHTQQFDNSIAKVLVSIQPRHTTPVDFPEWSGRSQPGGVLRSARRSASPLPSSSDNPPGVLRPTCPVLEGTPVSRPEYECCRRRHHHRTLLGYVEC